MKTLALVICAVVLAVTSGWAGSIHVNAEGCPVKVSNAYTIDPTLALDQVLHVKYKSVAEKPIQIVEFEVELQHVLSGFSATRKYLQVLKTPLLVGKGATGKFVDRGVDDFNVRQVKVLRIFYTDGTRWLDKDQTSTKPEAEEYQELISHK